MKRIAAIVLLLGVVCGAALSVSAKDDEDSGGKTYELLFDNAFGLTEGGDFKVAGVRAGQTKTFKVTKVDGRPLALVEAEVTEPGLADLRLEPYMGRLGDLTEAQTPVLRDLQSASGELDTFLTRLRPFTAEGLPAFRALGEASVVGRRAVRKTDEELRELRRLARDAPGFAKPLRQLLQTIDDRSRAVEPDRRAAASGPPAGDRTHTTSSRAGFTGMEAIWNFFYWQTLSTNALDDVGHVLRLTALVNECSPYEVKPSKEHLAKCNQFLGPTQPGVTTPDPTRPSAAAAAGTAPVSAPRDSGGRSVAGNPALDFLLGE